MRPSALSILLVCIGFTPGWAQSGGRSVSDVLNAELRSSAGSASSRLADSPSAAPVISSGKTSVAPARTSGARRALSDDAAPGSEVKVPVASDQAWTGGSGQLRDAQPLSEAGSVPRTLPAKTAPAIGLVPQASAPVVPAQFTSTEPSIPGFSAEAASASPATSKVLPLKPPTSSESLAKERSTGTVQMFVSVVSSLLIVIGLLLGAAWCYRRASPNTASSLPKDVLQVLGRAPLAPRQQLVLLRFNNKLVLVSNLQGDVRAISEITDPLEVDRVAGICESSQAGSISDSFRSVLHNLGRSA